ncbi:MAG: hypothetical protein KC468_20275 [Myxococcales bacterium]|nr:hypothetical protein [Myxococcales bacterium]
MTERSASLTAAIAALYETFAPYRLEDPARAGFFDFGPNERELRAISGPLRDIPAEVVRTMEFYAPDWRSWGSEAEVKYVLPRVLECLALHPELLGYPSTMSLFKHKLRRGLTPAGAGLRPHEREPVARFLELLLEHQATLSGASERRELGYLVEALVELRFDDARALAALDRHPAQHGPVADALLEHFRVRDADETPRGVFCEHEAGLRVYTDWALERWRAAGGWDAGW